MSPRRRVLNERIEIEFHKRARGRYHSILHRRDGVLIELEGGSYNRVGGAVPRVPHDIAHLIVEDAFGLRSGLWATLAAGGLVQNTTFAGGRKPPHAEPVMVRAVADAALEDRARDLEGLRRQDRGTHSPRARASG